MKRIDKIKSQLYNMIESKQIGEFERFLYELRNTEVFSNYIISILESFDMRQFRGVSDQEMSEIIRSGEYSIKLIEWLGEEI